MATTGLSFPPRIRGAQADGGPSPLTAAADRLWPVSRLASSGGGGPTSDLASPGWIWLAAQGRGRLWVAGPLPSLPQVVRWFLGAGGILAVPGGGSAPGVCFCVVSL
jgi:hypothetical protein